MLAIVIAVLTGSLPGLALASVPLAVLPNVSDSPLTRPDNAAVPLSASTVVPSAMRFVPDNPVTVSAAGMMVPAAVPLVTV